MATCRRCDAQLPEEAQFCPDCGLAVGPGESQTTSQPPSSAPGGQTPQGLPQGGPSTGIGPAPVQVTTDERNMAMLCHLAAFAGFLFPFGNILGPLIVWLMRRKDSRFIDFHGKEVLNFQITMIIYFIISAILIIVIIGFLLLAAVAIFDVVMTIIAAVRANDGVEYRYPLTIRMIR